MISISAALGQTAFVLFFVAFALLGAGGLMSAESRSKAGPILVLFGAVFGVLTLVCALASIWTQVG